MRPFSGTVVLVALAGFALAGCNRVVPSTELETGAIRADFRAMSQGTAGTEVRATLLSGGRRPDQLVPGEGDRLWAEVGGRRVFLKPDPAMLGVDFIARFPGVRPGDGCRFGLERRTGVPATGNFGVFPPGLTLAPIPGRRSREKDLAVRWAPALEGPMEVWVDGECIHFAMFDVSEDRGGLTVPAGRLEWRRKSEAESCEVEVTVRRLRAGRTDPALNAGSHVWAAQERWVRFVSVP